MRAGPPAWPFSPTLSLGLSIPFGTSASRFALFFQMIQAIQVLRFHLLELEKVSSKCQSLFTIHSSQWTWEISSKNSW